MRIEYATANGRKVTMEIITDNFMNDCFELEVHLEGIGTLGPIELEKSGLFSECYCRRIKGKSVVVKFPSTPESEALYKKYTTEVERRVATGIKADIEYQEHYNKVNRAMAG